MAGRVPGLALLALAAVACSKNADLHGAVTKAGKGVPGVTVTLECPGTPAQATSTNATGDFRFEELGAGVGDDCTVEAKSTGAWAGAQAVAGRCGQHDPKTGMCTLAIFSFELPN